jgi:hypothetical protein
MVKKRKVGLNTKQSGGLLIGPSHEDGGIIAHTPGQDPVELEGGEYIINAATTATLGTEFLDKLNRTASPHHSQPGFNQGELPESNYKGGGYIKKLQYGGSATERKQVNLKKLPESYRETNLVGQSCSNCNFFRANFCKNWANNVKSFYICDDWSGSKIIKSGDNL